MTAGRLHDHEEGALVTEAALLMPLVFFTLFVVVQFGLWMYANVALDQAATHAVQELAVAAGAAADNGGRGTSDCPPEYHGDCAPDQGGEFSSGQARDVATGAAHAVLGDVDGVKEVWVNGSVQNDGNGQAQAIVHLRGEAPLLVPGIDWSVESRKRAPLEQFLNFNER